MSTHGTYRRTLATVAPATSGPALREAEVELVRLLARQAAAEHIKALRRAPVRD